MIESLIALMIAREVTSQKIQLDMISAEYRAQQEQKEKQASGSGNANKGSNAAVKYNVTFDISSRGSLKGDVNEFANVVENTLTDRRGWARAGVKFTRVASGGRLHVVLASGTEIDKYYGCSAELSCTVYPEVLINDTRWLNATDSYNSAGLSLASYRQMGINHEVGHFLGHDHSSSCGAGGVAPVMLQQSTGLRGCTGNSWPLDSELWVTRW